MTTNIQTMFIYMLFKSAIRINFDFIYSKNFPALKYWSIFFVIQSGSPEENIVE